jgi:hypothetical protein
MHHRRALRDQPGNEPAYPAAPHNLLDAAQQTHLVRQWPLRRPEVGFVQHKMQRIRIGVIDRLGERRHEPPAGRTAAKFRHIDHAGQCLTGDQPAERAAHLRRERHIGMPSAEHDHRIAGCRNRRRSRANPTTPRADR